MSVKKMNDEELLREYSQQNFLVCSNSPNCDYVYLYELYAEIRGRMSGTK